MSAFENGYRAFTSLVGANMAAFSGKEYVRNVEEAINKLQNAINDLSKDGKSVDTLKGVVAEHWHTHTHNIDAVVKNVSARAVALESHVVGSVDIKGNWRDSDYGLKFYNDSDKAARAQSEIYRAKYEIFRKNQIAKGHQPLSYEDYFHQEYDKYLSECAKTNRTPQSIEEVFPGYNEPNNPLYMGQHRLIARDQLEDARVWLKRRVLEESNGDRPDQVKRYQETLDKLTDRVMSNEGSESIPISIEEAEELARLAKEEGFDPAKFGLTTESLIGWDDLMRQATQAGLSAAVISLVLEVAPELLKIIIKSIHEEDVNASDFKHLGFAALRGSTLGFLRGSIAAAITISCKSGKFGTVLKGVDTTVIGAVVALTMNTIQNATLMAFGQMTSSEFASRCIQDLVTTSFSLAFGSALQTLLPQLPVIGFLVGSFVGGVVGSFVYSTAYSCFISFCVDTGCTFFGLVKQDYTLPKEIMDELGLALFEYEKFEYETFEQERFEYEAFQHQKFDYTPIDIHIIRRGVIAINTIGFTT